MKKLLILLLSSGLLSSCFGLFDSDFEEMDGNFNIGWVDAHETQTVYYHPQGDMGGEEVIAPFIFAYGQNQEFIIAKQHPLKGESAKGEINELVTNYYIIRKNQQTFDKSRDVYGPYQEREFQNQLKTLKVGLIEFEKE